jgi:hypothetical protein
MGILSSQIEPSRSPQDDGSARGRWARRHSPEQEGGSMDLDVNGKRVSVEVDPTTPLLWVLRERLNLTGTKYGCGAAQCGACTVHLDGRAARSCVTPVSAVGRRRVTTIEGLDGKLGQALVQAWIEVDVPQCGYLAAQAPARRRSVAKAHALQSRLLSGRLDPLARPDQPGSPPPSGP